MKTNLAAALHAAVTRLLRIEMVMPRGTCDDFSRARNPQSLRIRFIRFHILYAYMICLPRSQIERSEICGTGVGLHKNGRAGAPCGHESMPQKIPRCKPRH